MQDRSSLDVVDALLEELYWGHRLQHALARVAIGVHAQDLLAYTELSPALLETLTALATRNETIPVPDYDLEPALIAAISGDPDFYWELDVEDWFTGELSEESLVAEIERVGTGGRVDQELADDLLEFCGSNAWEPWASADINPWSERFELGDIRPNDPLGGFIWDIRWGRLHAIEEGLDRWPWFTLELDPDELRSWLRVRRPVLEWRLARGESLLDVEVPEAGELLDLSSPLRSPVLNSEGALRLLLSVVLPGAAGVGSPDGRRDEQVVEDQELESGDLDAEERKSALDQDEDDLDDEEDDLDDEEDDLDDEEDIDESEDEHDVEEDEDDVPKPPPVPIRPDVRLPAVAWSWRKWDGAKKERPNPHKEALLRRSLDMVKGKKGNEEAIREIVEKSVEADLFSLAMDAIEGFGPDAAFDMYVSITRLFEDVGIWPLLDETFIAFCERRVLEGKTARSGLGWGDHFAEQRSCALGVLGRFRLIAGKPEMAVRLWAAGEDVIDVDEAIAETCDLIAQHDGSRLQYATSLTDLIRTEAIRAKTLASLSEYA